MSPLFVSFDIPQIEMRVMMIHNSLINRLETGSIQIDKIDWVSFMDSIFERNDGIDFINRIKNKESRNTILYYWIDNYDEIVGSGDKTCGFRKSVSRQTTGIGKIIY